MKKLLFIRLGGLLSLALFLGGSCSSDSGASPASPGNNMASSSSPSSPGGGEGQAGSMARFAIMGNTLYAVDESNLRTFDLSTPEAPARGPMVNIGIGVETIFPQAPFLFIGSQNGMFIYTTASGTPQRVGSYAHVTSCDPVVVDGRYAYVTLRDGALCGRGLNQLDVIDLINPAQPRLVQSYPMVQPFGLGVDSSQVFVCDQGIKVYDARATPTLRLKQSFNIAATDVIARQGILLVTGNDGLYQYRYAAAGAGNLQELSRIPVVRR